MSEQLGVIDLLSVIALALGYENLLENRAQSEQNDVQSANDKQAQYLLTELTKRFEEQNETLEKILKAVQDGS